MDKAPDEKRVGGSIVRVADCYIWAAISYLDSPTAYRECIPRVCDTALVFLDDQKPSPWKCVLTVTGILAVCGIAARLLIATCSG